MARYSADPLLVALLTITEDSGEVSTIEVRKGAILEDITFRNEGKMVTTTGKLTEIMINTVSTKTNVSDCPCEMKSAADDAIAIVGFVLDASSEYDSGVYFVRVSDIKSIGSVLENEVVLDNVTEPGALAKAIAELKPGQAAVLPAATITETLTIPTGVSLKGAQAGITATSGYRAQDVVDGETVIDAPVVLVSGTTVLDGITLSGAAVPKLGDAAGDKEVVMQMKNCRVVGLNDGTGKQMNAFMTDNNSNSVRFEVEDCYFGNNGEEMYNLFNMHGKWRSGSYIKNCYFAKDCCQNTISIYDTEDNAVIEITDNYWESSKNGIRILAKGSCKFELYIKNNTWADTDMPQENGDDWGGLFMCQPHGTQTVTQKDIFVYMSGNVNKSENPQEWYYYGQSGENVKYPVNDVEDRPRIFINGELQSYEGHEYIDVM